MANEAIQKDRMGTPINMKCGETAMEKGTILMISADREVGPSASDGDVFGGILRREKIHGDGRTHVPASFDGIFDCVFDSAVTLGADVTISAANILKTFTAGDSEDGTVVGKVLQTVGVGGGTFEVLLKH